MNKLFACHRCGVIARAERQLCKPAAASPVPLTCPEGQKETNSCGSHDAIARYVCRNCGQPALEAELICNPYM